MIILLFRRCWPLLLLAGCADSGPRVYTAQPFDAEAGCLGEYEAVALVEADELPANCPATCLDIGGTLYVSTVCPPLPDSATELLPEDDESCAAALAAATCE